MLVIVQSGRGLNDNENIYFSPKLHFSFAILVELRRYTSKYTHISNLYFHTCCFTSRVYLSSVNTSKLVNFDRSTNYMVARAQTARRSGLR